MILQTIIDTLSIHNLLVSYNGKGNTAVNSIQNDSRKVSNNDLFVCIDGYEVDGHDFIESAILNGASAIVAEKQTKKSLNIPIIYVKNTRESSSIIANALFNEPTKKLNVIGVTGTNGKTTTSHIIYDILNFHKIKTGIIGTINVKYSDFSEKSSLTTPDEIKLHQHFHNMSNSGVSRAVIEVSSHALKLNRVNNVSFKTAIFTNLSQDHLDFHKNFDDYKETKSYLFSGLQPYLNPPRNSIINNDDPYSEFFTKKSNSKVFTYGIENKSDLQATNIKITNKGSSFDLAYGNKKYFTRTNLIGRFNIYNLLASIQACLLEGLEMETIIESIPLINDIEGRMEVVEESKETTIIIDFAHTPDGLEKLLSNLKAITNGRVITVFGCGGNRDKNKRKKMGYITDKLSDFTILTSDNPRKEDPLKILNDIEQGLHSNNYEIIIDREEAIKKAISLANKEDCIVIAGKGHEKYQIIGNKKNHFDDKEVVKKILNQNNK